MKDEILSFIKQNKCIEVPALQYKYKLSYKETKAIIDELTANGTIVFDSGVRYICAKKFADTAEVNGAGVEPKNADAEEQQREDINYLEARRQEILRRMRAGYEENEDNVDDDDDDEEEIDEYDDEDDLGLFYDVDEEIDEEELHVKALQLCIEKNEVSASMFHRELSINIIKACQLIDWLENMGYISESDGTHQRKILISQEQFNKLFVKETIDEKADSDDGNETEEQDDGSTDLRSVLIECLEQGLQYKSDDENYILGLNGELQFELKFVNDGSALKLSDGGKTLAQITQTARKINKVLKDFAPVILEEGEICITIENPYGTLMALLTLYSAVNAIKKMK